MFTLALFSAACSHGEKMEKPVAFFFLNSQITYGAEDGVFSSEERECTGLSTEEILRMYLKGPETPELISPFPANTFLISLLVSESDITITLSDSYAHLTGLELTKANACIAKTLFAFSQADRVIICCESKPLNGETRIQLTRSDLIFVDQSIGSATKSIPETTQE